MGLASLGDRDLNLSEVAVRRLLEDLQHTSSMSMLIEGLFPTAAGPGDGVQWQSTRLAYATSWSRFNQVLTSGITHNKIPQTGRLKRNFLIVLSYIFVFGPNPVVTRGLSGGAQDSDPRPPKCKAGCPLHSFQPTFLLVLEETRTGHRCWPGWCLLRQLCQVQGGLFAVCRDFRSFWILPLSSPVLWIREALMIPLNAIPLNA